MNNGTLALSIDDFTSGRFNQVAQFIRENWPYGNRPSGNETLEILAKSLGYHDYSEAMSSATSVPPPMFTLFHKLWSHLHEVRVQRLYNAEHKISPNLFSLNLVTNVAKGNKL